MWLLETFLALNVLLQISISVVLGFLAMYAAQTMLANYRMDKALSGLPSAPGRGLPFLGHVLLLVGAEPWRKMCDWALASGHIVQFRVFSQRVLYVSHPKLLKRVLTRTNLYQKHLPSYSDFLCLLGTSLVTSEGAVWARGRKLWASATKHDALLDIPGIAVASAKHLAERAVRHTAIDLNEEYRHLTLQVIGKAVLSMDAEECNTIFPKLYLPIVEECNNRVFSPWRRYMPWLHGWQEHRSCLGKLNKLLSKLVAERWMQNAEGRTEVKGDLLDKAIEIQLHQQKTEDGSNNKKTTAPAPEIVNQLRDDIKTLLLAGHETSAAALTWATYELICHPEVAAKVRAEYDEVFGKRDPKTTPLDFKITEKLTWSPAVLRETLRKYSVVPQVMRYATKDDVIPAEDSGIGKELRIPQGCAIMVGINGIHGCEKAWPNPTVWDPSRFVGRKMDPVNDFEFIPFIAGPRRCLGQELSFTETQIVLSHIFGTLDLELVGDKEQAGQRHDYMIPVCPANGLMVRARRRELA